MDGSLLCSRYAFGPNRLHYCGPDANREIFAYIQNNATDVGLQMLLKAFRTLYPYLELIASSNNIRDPFDPRVVEAYWIGNKLLENVEKKKIYRHLVDALGVKKKIGNRSFDLVADTLGKGALPHHSFHVFSIWRRTGDADIAHTLESMDSCRISSGKVMKVDGPFLTVETEPLEIENGKLALGKPVIKRINRDISSPTDIEQIKIGEIITMHWGVPCEVISPEKARALKKYTLRHIALANQIV
ncbi:hypothetical protein KKF59_03470 [Patescibacteria group bacterium]|nr:hypothetical protein [Patescibacteria group bacterium]